MRGKISILSGMAMLAIALSVFLRFFDLTSRPFHHDESLYAYYSFTYAQGLLYRYDPLLHGPFMFHWLAALFRLFHDSDLIVRLSGAFFSLLLFLSPLLFRPLFNRSGAFAFWLAASFSPLLLYYARFMRCDSYALFFTFAAPLAFFCFRETQRRFWLYLAAALLALAFCTKENAYLHLFLFLFFWLPLHLWGPLHPPPSPPLPRRHWLGLGLTFATLYVFFYSSMFQYWPGVIDGLYRKSLIYWFEQNRLQRTLLSLGYTFDFYLQLLLIYEIPLLLAFVAAWGRCLWRRRPDFRALGWGTALFVVAAGLSQLFAGGALDISLPRLHLDAPWHLPLLGYLIFLTFLTARHHLRQGETRLAFFGYLAFAFHGLYAYLGERFPWLSLYPLAAMVFYLAMIENIPQTALFGPWLAHRRRGWRLAAVSTLALLLSFNAFNALRASFVLVNQPRERLVEIAYVPQLPEILSAIDEARERHGGATILLYDAPAWPFNWYLRHRGATSYLTVFPEIDYDLVLTDPQVIASLPPSRRDGYACSEYTLREWWVPDPRQATPRTVLRYWLFREPYSASGRLPFSLCVHKRPLL